MKNKLQFDFYKIFDIRRHWPIRHTIRCPIARNMHHWTITGHPGSWCDNSHFANCVFANIMQEWLDNAGESAVPNLWDNLAKLCAWHQCQQIVPIFQRELAEIVVV
jgi:hypothetical protein